MKTHPMKKTILALAFAAGLTSFEGSLKALTVFTDKSSFLSQIPNPSYDTLNELGSDGYNWNNPVNSITAPGFTSSFNISSTTGQFFVDSPNWYSLQNSTYRILSVPWGGSMTISFNLPVNAIGFEFSALFDPQTAIITTTDVNGNSVSGSYNALNYGTGQYYGVISLNNLLSVIVTDADSSSGVDIGNFAYSTASVPEPSTYALFGIGAIGLLMVMRRKKTA